VSNNVPWKLLTVRRRRGVGRGKSQNTQSQPQSNPQPEGKSGPYYENVTLYFLRDKTDI